MFDTVHCSKGNISKSMKQGKMKQSVYASCFFLPDKDMLWPNGQSFPQRTVFPPASSPVQIQSLGEKVFLFGLSHVAVAPESHELYEREFHALC